MIFSKYLLDTNNEPSFVPVLEKKLKSNMTICCYFSQEAYSLLDKTDINQTITYNEHKFTNQAKLSDAK